MIENHVKDPSTKVIKGTFRGRQKVNIYYNKKTGVLVLTKGVAQDQNLFISAWKYSLDQYIHIVNGGNLQ